jgi:hypothetical protein
MNVFQICQSDHRRTPVAPITLYDNQCITVNLRRLRRYPTHVTGVGVEVSGSCQGTHVN